jgi:hypothetical protein
VVTDYTEQLYQHGRGLPAEQRAAMLRFTEADIRRKSIRKRYANAADLASSVDPTFNITPAIAMIADAVENVLEYPRCNLLVTMPPQEGKSSLCSVWTPLRALQRDPNKRIILASYGGDLAVMQSMLCRDIILKHGSGVTDSITGAEVEDKIGLKLAKKQNTTATWRIEGGTGGLSARGIGSPITGRPADLFIIDDPYKNMMEADSASYRRRVSEWFSSVAITRLSPEASMILIQTRWHPEDLSGQIITGEALLEEDERTWRHINIPAISETGIYDSLGRPDDTVMVSARGRTRAEFDATRRAVGERTWYALYQGSPRIPAGGLFAREWFEPHVESPPAMPIASIVAIDPADSGEGDETGIIGGSLDQDGTVVLTEDWSGQMTSDQWARQAVTLALTIGAREIAMEAFATATTYAAVIKRAWRDLRDEAVAKHATGALLSPVERRAVSAQMPFSIHEWRARGDDVARSALFRQALETKKCRLVEYKLGVFESQAADWQQGQHQPDRVAAALICHDRLAALGSGRMSMSTPIADRPTDAPDWLRRRITG